MSFAPAVLLASVASLASVSTPLDPAAAIRLADAHPERASTATFRMTVAASERTPNAVYLNSSADYRSPDDVTFHLTTSAADTLKKRFGTSPEQYLRGKSVTVTGAIRAVPIANTVNQRPHSLNRYQHTVLIDHAAQVIAVE